LKKTIEAAMERELTPTSTLTGFTQGDDRPLRGKWDKVVEEGECACAIADQKNYRRPESKHKKEK